MRPPLDAPGVSQRDNWLLLPVSSVTYNSCHPIAIDDMEFVPNFS